MQSSPGIRSIWVKVFGLTATLVSVMLVAAIVSFTLSYFKVNDVRQRVSNLAHLVQPLTRAAANIDAFSLQEEVQLERTLRRYTADADDVQALQSSIDQFNSFEHRVVNEIDSASAVLGATLADPEWLSPADAVEFGRIAGLLENVEKEHREYFQLARSVLSDLPASGINRAEDVIQELEDEADHLDQELYALLSRLELLNATQAEEIEAAESLILEIYLQNFALTITVFLVGIAASAMITTKLVTPVKDLKEKSQEITRGNLDISVTPQTRDEVGQLALAFNHMTSELRLNRQVKELFGKYVDPRIVESLLATDAAQLDFAGQKQEMTILFTDVQGFSSLSELLTPGALVNLLNQYFNLMAEPIIAEKGVIDKYIGDCVMAFWGPPFTGAENPAVLACRAALAQFDQLRKFNQALPDILGFRKAVPEVHIRLGIGTGDIVAGNIGSENARSYTVIGDKVNIASRLESLNKYYGTRILIGELTRIRIGDAFTVREVDQVVVAGKHEAIRIFELQGPADAADAAVQTLFAAYQSALEFYRAGQWDEASAAFEQCLELAPQDGPSRTMRQRVAELRSNPPSEPWDGIWRFTVK